MKISPVSAAGTTIGAISGGPDAPQTMSQKVRSLRMSTNANPPKDPADHPPIEELPISDASVDQAKETDEATQPLSPQFAALAKQRRALQQERQQLDKEKADYAASKQDVESVPLAKLKSNAMRTLIELGIPYEQLTKEIMADQDGYNPEIQALKDKIAALETGIDKKLTDREQQQKQAALSEMKREASEIVNADPKLMALKDDEAIDQVIEYIEQKYLSTGEVMDVRVACQKINQWLIEDAKRRSKWLQAEEGVTPQQLPPQPQQQQRQMRTLTNRDTASVPLDKKARAIMAFKGTLKK